MVLARASREAARFIANSGAAATTAVRSLALDPVSFAMQLSRRFPQLADLPVRVIAAGSDADAMLVREWSRGKTDDVEAMLAEQSQRGGLTAFAGEIAVALGLPDLVVDDPRVRALTRARAAWMLGDIAGALELSPSRRYSQALRAERAMMTPGNMLAIAHDSAPKYTPRENSILHVLTNSLPHTTSGYTMRSHNILLAQRDLGLDVTAITRVGYPVIVGGLRAAARDVVDGIEYVRVLPPVLAAQPDARLVQQAHSVTRLAMARRSSVLHTTTNYVNGVVALAVAQRLGLPWCYEVRGMQEQTWLATLRSEEARERAHASERYRLIRAREAQLAADADAVFTLSEGMQSDLVSRGVARESIAVVPNGVSQELLDAPLVSGPDGRRALGLDPEGFWVGAVSSLVDYEGFDTLVEAVKLLRADGHDVRLLLVGDGVSRPALLAAAAELGEYAVLPGRVPRDQARAYLNALDVVIVPRKDRAVTRSVAPLKPVEAMAAGKPVIVSDLPPLIETIGPDLAQMGSTFPPGDAGALGRTLGAMSSSADSLRVAGKVGCSRARTRSWAQQVENQQRCYLKIVR